MTLISHLLSNPAFTSLRRFQLFAAVIIYLVMMLMNDPPLDPDAYSDKNLHMLGNFLLFTSIWVALGEKVKTYHILFLAVPFSIFAEVAQSLTLSRVLRRPRRRSQHHWIATWLCIVYNRRLFLPTTPSKQNQSTVGS